MLTVAKFIKLSILPLAILVTTSHTKITEKLKYLRAVEAIFPLARGRGANRRSFIGKTISSEDLLLVAIHKYTYFGCSTIV